MKSWVFVGVMCLWIGETSGVSFTRYIIDQNLSTPHGDWAGDVKNDNPAWVMDAFATISNLYEVAWYENLGFGTLWGPKNTIYTASGYYSHEVAAADLDNDGDVDVVSAHFQWTSGGISYLALHQNNGLGSFTTTTLPSHSVAFRQIRVRDVNADNMIDIIVAGCDPSSWYTQEGLYWYKNNGGMSFTENFVTTCNGWKLDLFDDDGDGHLEIVVSEHYSSPCRLLLYKNNGAEVFSESVIDPDLGSNPEGAGGVRCADFDGDGDIDIVSGSLANGVIYWYENLGGSSFTKHTIDNSAPKFDGVDVCDFDVDMDMDFVACGRNYWMAWYENDGSANFTKHIIDTDWELFDLPFITYMDGDSCCDIIVTEASASTGHLLAYLNPCETCTEESSAMAGKWLKVPSVVRGGLVNIGYSVGNSGEARIEVMDITGRVIQVLAHHCNQPGVYNVVWDASGNPNGVYILKLLLENTSPISKKVIVIRGK